MTFLSKLPSGDENCENSLNPVSWVLYQFLSGSAFLLSYTAPNKQLRNMKSVFPMDLVCKKYIDLLLITAKILPNEVIFSILSFDIPLDFHE